MQIRIKNQTCLSDCPESLRTVLSARLAYLTSHGLKMSVWADGTARRRNFYAALRPIRTDPADNLIIPRGYIPYLLQLCCTLNISFSASDQGSGCGHRIWKNRDSSGDHRSTPVARSDRGAHKRAFLLMD